MTALIKDIEKLRSKMRWSQERMAREIGVSFTAYNGWINKGGNLRETSEKAIKSVLVRYRTRVS